MANISITIEELNQMQPLDIAENAKVREKFINIWNTRWGDGTGEAAYEREAQYFCSQLRDKPELQQCTRFSIFTAFIDLAVCGLSVEPGARALTYLMSRNINVGTRDRAAYESRLVLTVSAYGELAMRVRCGQIRHADNPVLVYDNDVFSFSDRDGRKTVDYTMNMPHTGHRVVACYLRITRADSTIDYFVMTEEDWVRLANYSYKNNTYYDKAQGKRVSRGANELYGVDAEGKCHIDTGFLMAKCIKHAFKTYPKMRFGRGTELESEQTEEKEIEINDALYGGIAEPNVGQPCEEPQAFGNPEQPAGVTVESDDDAF